MGNASVTARRRQELQEHISLFLSGEGDSPPEGFTALKSALGNGPETCDWTKVDGLPEVLEEKDLINNPTQLAVNVIEPWEHVGHNSNGEEVRASVNIALFAKAVGLDSQVIPLWKIRCGYPVLPAEDLVEGLIRNICVFEGGAPDVYDESTFHVDTASRDFLWDMYKRVLLARHRSEVCIFICLSHQMVASSLVELVKDAVDEMSRGSEDAKALAKEIEEVGNKIQIVKEYSGGDDGPNVVAEGFRHQKFATARNQVVEAALLDLHKFSDEDLKPSNDELQKCLEHHTQYAAERSGVLEAMMERKEDDGARVAIAMFHGVEVNYEAAVFCNWAFSKIASLRGKPGTASWLADLPVGVEVTSCTKAEDDVTREDGKVLTKGSVVTDVASMRIDYEFRGEKHHSYTCQFHPELTSSLRDARYDAALDFKELSAQHGQRMLARFLEDNI